MPDVTPFEDVSDAPAVRGFLHQPDAPGGHGLVLTHGGLLVKGKYTTLVTGGSGLTGSSLNSSNQAVPVVVPDA